MNSSLVISCALLVGIFCFSSANPFDNMIEHCKEQGPTVFCMTDSYAERCQSTEYCKSYIRDVICPAGPEAYCEMEKTAKDCGKEEFCSTWSVTVNLTFPEQENSKRRKHEESFGDFLLRIIGTSAIRYRGRWVGF